MVSLRCKEAIGWTCFLLFSAVMPSSITSLSPTMVERRVDTHSGGGGCSCNFPRASSDTQHSKRLSQCNDCPLPPSTSQQRSACPPTSTGPKLLKSFFVNAAN
ncbi:hypothetical protein K469DRAFT_397054 [Zopfia rhizophila CBS 207.26]|uniref:Secreted protein n=1 Tax=Zopfia rhizophila CBS 207.26 TaxID=1314779 RepID=A0A6A6DB48_9PEZI|nr:hypothetical protein K469DRAFT_397054 [Zopfia rhizophila CBS 207.26]